MTTYNTGNPVPSGDARDRFDNTQTLDEVVTGSGLTTVTRTGKTIKTLAGQQQDFNKFLISSGFEPDHLIYAVGSALTVNRPTQLIDYNGSVYRVKMPSTFPVNLTGVWASDSAKLVDVGDLSLRQSLGSLEDMSQGASLVPRAIQWVRNVAKLKKFAGLYQGQVIRLGAASVLGDRGAAIYEWDGTSTATGNDREVVAVTGVSTGRWLETVQRSRLGPLSTTVTEIGNAPTIEADRLAAMFKAERIRRNAGLQPWVVLGPADPSQVGLTTDPRVTSAVISITSAASAAAVAGSGTGTLLDPYVIKNRNITPVSGTPGVVLNDPAATYYVKLYNCYLSGSTNGSSFINMAAFGTNVVFERCRFTGAGGAGGYLESLVQISSGSIEFKGCEISGISTYIFVGAGLTSKKGKMTDCIVQGNANTANTNGVFYAAAAGQFEMEIYRCSFLSRHFHWHVGNGWTIDYLQVQDTIIGGCAVAIGDLNYLKPGNIYSQVPNMIRHSNFKNVRFTYTAGVTQTACYGNGADQVTFENCSFEGSAVDRRLFEWRRTSGVTMRRCYFSKTVGNNTAGNEVCEFWETAGLLVTECWANGAPEDCYELVSSYGNNRFIDNVGDNVAGQLVDIFGVGSFDVEIDGVYGDCGDAAVLITDVDYVRVTNVHVLQTGTSALGSVVLERRNAAPNVSPKGCSITGPLSLPSVCSQGKPFAVDTRYAAVAGGIGANFATWWEGSALQTYGSATPARLTLR